MEISLNLPIEILKKIYEIYPYYIKNLKNEGSLKVLWDEIFEYFKKYFQEFDELYYILEKDKFLYKNEPFFPKSPFNLHKILYENKIRIILFQKDLKKEELENFLEITLIPFSKLQYKDQSLKTFFERENFENIKLFYKEEEENLKEGRENFSFFINLSKNLQNENLLLTKDKKILAFDFIEKDIPNDIISNPIKKSLNFIFEETILSILSQYEKETNNDYKILLLQSLRYLFQEAVNFGNLREVNFILRNLKLSEDKNLKDLFLEFQGEEIFKNLIKSFEIVEIFKIEELNYFLENLNPSSQKIFFHKIFEEKITKFKEEIYEFLNFKFQRDINLFWEIYYEMDIGEIQNFLYLIQKLPMDMIKEEELLSHKNLNVKAQILKICKKVSDKNLFEFLDSSNLEMRLQALSYIERFRKEAFVPILISRIKKESFYEKERIEKEKYFDVLAKIKNNEAINFLKDFLTEHKLFSSQKREELRAMAALALASTKDPKFKEIFLRESKNISNSSLVKEACKRASSIIGEKKEDGKDN